MRGGPDAHEGHAGLESIKVEGEGLADGPAHKHQEGHHQQRDLEAAADRHPDGQVHLALVRRGDGRDVLGGVADDGEQDQAHEGLAHAPVGGDLVDGADEELGDDRNDRRGGGEQGPRPPQRQDRVLLLLLIVVLVQVRVRLELEGEVAAVDQYEHHRGEAGAGQHRRSGLRLRAQPRRGGAAVDVAVA